MGSSSSLSIVIGTKDRPAALARCLASIAAQTMKPDEVLVIDDGRLDADAALQPLEAAGIQGRYFNKSLDRGLTKSRNLGIRESRGDVVMFLDDDVVLAPDYIAEIMRVYREYPHAAAVGGRLTNAQLPVAKQFFLRVFLLDSAHDGAVLPNGIGVLVRAIHEVTPVDWLSGCNMSFRREVFSEFVFDEEFGGNGWGDDRDFSYRVSRKYLTLAAPCAAIHHDEEPSGRQTRYDFGRTEILYMYRFFHKHMPQRPINRLALAWAFVGITLHNVIARRPGRVRGNISALSELMLHRSSPREIAQA